MSENSYYLHLKELRHRIENLNRIENKLLYFQEVARLVNWIEKNNVFNDPLKYLLDEKKHRESSVSNILKEMFEEIEIVWNDIKKIKCYKGKVSDLARESKRNLLTRFKNPHNYYALDFYHDLRHLVEELAQSDFSKDLHRYYVQHIRTRTPLISGKIYDLFLSYGKETENIKKQLDHAIWGAWSMLYQVYLISQEYNAGVNLSDWAGVFKKEEYNTYLNKFSDFLFDYKYLNNRKFKQQEEHSLLKVAIWSDNFIVKDGTLSLGEYGKLAFDRTKSPLKKPNEDRVIPLVEKLTNCVVDGGKDGQLLNNVLSILSIKHNDISGTIDHLNKRFDKCFKKGEFSAKVEFIIFGERGNKKIRLLVVPKPYTYDAVPAFSSNS